MSGETMLILGIETSCDETSVAVVDGRGRVRSNLIQSQIERHRPFGGVVPEIASREHLEAVEPLIHAALERAGVGLEEIGGIAVTNGPGLIGALLVGVAAAQGLAYARGLQLAPVNHLEGHIFSPYLRSEGEAVERPEHFWSIVVSGGHSSVYSVTRSGAGRAARMLNKTRDDAAGEVLDKVAKVVGLPYPGGPEIERCARGGNARRYLFRLAKMKNDSLDFSFSGLKSMAIREARSGAIAEGSEGLADFAASFQRAVVDQIIDRLESLWDTAAERPTELGVAGGVAANTLLRERVTEWCATRGLIVRLPEKVFCTDNAAMIAFAALNRGEAIWSDPRTVPAYSRAAGAEKGPPKLSSPQSV